MKKAALFVVLAAAIIFSGCNTISESAKGFGEGISKDWGAVKKADDWFWGAVKKADDWFRKNCW